MQSGDTPPNSSKISFLVLISAALLLAGLWWVDQAGQNRTNLLVNPDFEEGLVGWEPVEAGDSLALKPAVDDPGNTVLAMSIPSSDDQSWVAVKHRLDHLTPDQPYRLTVNYRLPHEGQTLAKVILRVVQLDQAGNPIEQDEISDPNLLSTGLDDDQRLAWSSLTHRLVPHRQTAVVEIYIALFGRQATQIELDYLALEAEEQPGWIRVARVGLILLLITLLLGTAIGYLRQSESAAARLVRKWGTVAAVNIIIFLILAELAGLGIYFGRNGSLFYTHKKQYELIGAGEEKVQPANDLAENLTARRFHPFFGFVVQPGADERFNNYGFISPYDYPYLKSSDEQFIIGVFGGSVAQIFTEEETRTKFIQSLKNDPFFEEKEIVVLNFAAGAYKQPQQLIVLSYFLSIGQQFDMVINIDGFNEVAMSYINYQNGVDTSMPVSFIMLPLMNLTNRTTPSPETIESLARINTLRARLNRLARTLDNNQSAFINFILEQYYAFTLERYRAELAALEQAKSNVATSLIYVNPVEKKLDETSLFENVAQTWANASIMMSQISDSQAIPYFHFLQPNQYYSGKEFSQEEAKIAINPNQVYRTGAEKGYPFLVEQADTLTQNGVNFHNGLDIYNNETAAVYGDDCCHYNELGNQILAEFIAGTILKARQ